jgi:hypothetical protein
LQRAKSSNSASKNKEHVGVAQNMNNLEIKI